MKLLEIILYLIRYKKVNMKEDILKKIIGYILIGLVVIVTISLIKVLPVIMKLLALAANIVTIYLAYNYFINNKNKKN